MPLIELGITFILLGGILNIAMTPDDFGQIKNIWKRILYHFGWTGMVSGLLMLIWYKP